MSLKLLVKALLHSVFSLITWITKLWIKQPVERPQQILAKYECISWKAFELSLPEIIQKITPTTEIRWNFSN